MPAPPREPREDITYAPTGLRDIPDEEVHVWTHENITSTGTTVTEIQERGAGVAPNPYTQRNLGAFTAERVRMMDMEMLERTRDIWGSEPPPPPEVTTARSGWTTLSEESSRYVEELPRVHVTLNHSDEGYELTLGYRGTTVFKQTFTSNRAAHDKLEELQRLAIPEENRITWW